MWNHKHPITQGFLLQEQGCPCTPNGTGLPSALHPEGRTAWPLPKQVVLPEQLAWDNSFPPMETPTDMSELSGTCGMRLSIPHPL